MDCISFSLNTKFQNPNRPCHYERESEGKCEGNEGEDGGYGEGGDEEGDHFLSNNFYFNNLRMLELHVLFIVAFIAFFL